MNMDSSERWMLSIMAGFSDEIASWTHLVWKNQEQDSLLLLFMPVQYCCAIENLPPLLGVDGKQI